MQVGKILIVDDEVQNLELLRSMLQSTGWDVITATNGREALETVQSSKPCVIILDMIMPEIDGFQVARSLKSHPEYCRIPIVAATSLSTHTDRQRCFAAGCDEFMAKPFTAGRLQKLLLSLP